MRPRHEPRAQPARDRSRRPGKRTGRQQLADRALGQPAAAHPELAERPVRQHARRSRRLHVRRGVRRRPCKCCGQHFRAGDGDDARPLHSGLGQWLYRANGPGRPGLRQRGAGDRRLRAFQSPCVRVRPAEVRRPGHLPRLPEPRATPGGAGPCRRRLGVGAADRPRARAFGSPGHARRRAAYAAAPPLSGRRHPDLDASRRGARHAVHQGRRPRAAAPPAVTGAARRSGPGRSRPQRASGARGRNLGASRGRHRG